MIDKRIASPAELQAIEDELNSPIGAPIPPPPLMAMSAVAMSPDCGFVIQSKASPDYPPQDGLYLTGLKREHLKLHVERFLILLSCIFLTQSFFLQRQMKESSTPSTKSRVSFWTIAMMSLADSLALSFAVLSVLQNANPLLILATGFAGFSGIAFLGMKFQVDLWMTQAPERHEARQQQQQRIQQQLQEQRQRRQQETQRLQQRSPQQPNQQPRQGEGQQEEASPGAAAQANEGLPRPVTAPPVSQQEAPTPIFMPFDQDMTQPEEPATESSPGRDAAMMYYRFYFTFFSFFIITSWVLIWPKEIRYIYGYAMTFLYLSFWTPQIYRNIMRNCRKALSWEFVIGESICRLFLPVYILTTRGNIFYIETDGRIAFAMVAWVWAQSWILAGQDLIGPRFFVPKGWAPPAYDYHPLLRDDSSEGSGEDVEAGDTLPLGFLRADEHETSEAARGGNKAVGRNKHVFDCAICMQDIEVPVISKGDAGGRSHVADSATSIFARRQYMVTPCRHIFHSTCLESWMRLRLQCPICRETIPPV
ncbi:hypothetical protein KEM55_002224 [Ascosphaera atra]|nr:hypothetical protein KEM55_002224 [Ascosphaera atra]